MDNLAHHHEFGRVLPRGGGAGLVHLFGSMGQFLSGLDYPAFTKAISLREVCDSCARTWAVTLTGTELQRFTQEAPLAPLPEDAFSNVPAGVLLVPRSQLKFRITADLGTGGLRRFGADAGQSFEVHANRVCIEWLAPESFFQVWQNQNPAIASQTGFIVDAKIGSDAAIVETAIGLRDVTFTTHQFIAATAAATIVIPAYAQEVTIYQTAAGGAATSWIQQYGDAPVGPIPIGSIPFLAGLRKTQPEILLPDATHLRSDIDAANDRFFTLRWRIKP